MYLLNYKTDRQTEKATQLAQEGSNIAVTEHCCSTQDGLFFCFMNTIVIWLIVLCGITVSPPFMMINNGPFLISCDHVSQSAKRTDLTALLWIKASHGCMSRLNNNAHGDCKIGPCLSRLKWQGSLSRELYQASQGPSQKFRESRLGDTQYILWSMDPRKPGK